MGWICKYCSTYCEDGDERCVVCDTERYLSAPRVLTAPLVLRLKLKGDVVIPQEYHIIGENAFRNHKDITSLTLHERVLEISDGAFSGCVELKRVSAPVKLQRIGVRAFYNCKHLKKTGYPTAEVIGTDAFTVPLTPEELAARDEAARKERARKEREREIQKAQERLAEEMEQRAMRAQQERERLEREERERAERERLARKAAKVKTCRTVIFSVVLLAAIAATLVLAFCSELESDTLQWLLLAGIGVGAAFLWLLMYTLLGKKRLLLALAVTLGVLCITGAALIFVAPQDTVIARVLCGAVALAALVIGLLSFFKRNGLLCTISTLVFCACDTFLVLEMIRNELIDLSRGAWPWGVGGALELDLLLGAAVICLLLYQRDVYFPDAKPAVFRPYRALCVVGVLQTACGVALMAVLKADMMLVGCTMLGCAFVMALVACFWSFGRDEEAFGAGSAFLALIDLIGVFVSLGAFGVFG